MWRIYQPSFPQAPLDTRAGKGQQHDIPWNNKGLPVTAYLLCAVSPRQESAEVSWVRCRGVDELCSVAVFTCFCFTFFFPPMKLSSVGASCLSSFFLSPFFQSNALGNALLKHLRAALLPILSQCYFAFLTYCLIFAWMPLDLYFYYLLFTSFLFHIPFTVCSFNFA